MKEEYNQSKNKFMTADKENFLEFNDFEEKTNKIGDDKNLKFKDVDDKIRNLEEEMGN